MSQEIFDENMSFADLGLRNSLLKGVTEAGFEHPTDIQAKLIPAALEGSDVIGQAKTGTGKTAAFGLPIMQQADKNIPMQALILVPTRELAAQVSGELEELGKYTPIKPVCVIGGESMRSQVKSLKGGRQMVVGTPGRIMDLQSRRQLSFDKVRWVVLDEVDRMLDIGFREDIRKILKSVKNDHQTLFVSATISDEIERLAKQYLKDDVKRIYVKSGSLTVSLVDQKHLPVEPWDKQQLLLHLLRHEKPETTVVFCRTKATVNKLSRLLKRKKINCREIHGDLQQGKRNRVMAALRKDQVDVLIASDLAARGLDVEHITHVINYDLPEDPEVYIHRIGRTARAGRRGVAWSFVTPDQGQLLTEIEKLCGVWIEKLEYPDFKPGPVPDDVKAEVERRKRPLADPDKVLSDRAQVGVDVSKLSKQQIETMFPGGVIPKSAPKRTLGTRFRSRRGR